MEQSIIVYVGRKPVRAYCLAVMSALRGRDSEVTVMARGLSISKAVNVVEIVRNKYVSDLVVKKIGIGTEHLEFDDGTRRNVSNIAITLAKD